ncbi:MAG: Rieske 2Fe-2S domain-containing protein [Rhodospirillales bacterium]
MSWKKVCESSQVLENSLQKFAIDGVDIIIANYGDGFRAFPPFCPHMEEPLVSSGMMMAGILTCSKHLWQWDLRSGEILGETEKELLFYDLKREGEDIIVNFELELSYDYGDDEEDAMDDDDFFNAD